MQKKILIIIIGIIIIVAAAIGVYSVTKANDKEAKAKEVFGEENCDVVLHMATRDLAPHTCKICGKEFQDSSMRADICTECANATNRCDFCGKILSEEAKQQREEILGK